MADVTDITLERDGHDQPWGFRLQGGKDIDAPLSVQRVLVGTPADGFLKRGDNIVTIDSTDVKNLSHQKAADLFTKWNGNTIKISVKRTTKNSTTKSTIIPGPDEKIVKIISRAALTTVGKQKVVKTFDHFQGWHPDKQGPSTTNQIQPTTNFPPTNSISSAKVNSFINIVPDNMDRQLSSPQSRNNTYNNPINLYSNQNVSDIARLNQMGQSPVPSQNRAITPNKPHQVLLSPSKDYNPKESATWHALQESTDSGVINVTNIPANPNLHEYDPIFASVYSVHKHAPPAGEHKPNPGLSPAADRVDHAPVSPIPNPLSPRPAAASSVKLPPSVFTQAAHPAMEEDFANEPQTLTPRSATSDRTILPIYETNSIGGRKRITQSATFNKLMMDVLGI